MKLRIRGNSIRLRLTQSEVAQFGKTGKVCENVEFGYAKPGLSYQLYSTVEDETMQARFENNCLYVGIPIVNAEHWVNSDVVEIEARQALDGDGILRILVEKDFACLTERENEDDSDSFMNPLSQANCG